MFKKVATGVGIVAVAVLGIASSASAASPASSTQTPVIYTSGQCRNMPSADPRSLAPGQNIDDAGPGVQINGVLIENGPFVGGVTICLVPNQ